MTTYLAGSRASGLARTQARGYLALFRERTPSVAFIHRVIVESGDRDRTARTSDLSAARGGSAFSSARSAPRRRRRSAAARWTW
ncbi:hypothetical protein V2S66_29640 [Streptomyces sp. V4-01]|uniref:DAD domain-containing protein n=1 Tax=Actinacidiphila polyblastidii TaxID=3110430 RepID=A0ABU7PLL5_9ACTN|nr:hypothetical protein [Streptomyces sp. V4-01]